MATGDSIRETFDIRPGEGRKTAFLLAQSFFVGIVVVFIETAAMAMFLAAYDIKLLPWVYIARAVVVTLAGFGYSRLDNRLSTPILLMSTLSILFISILAFRGGLLLTEAPWIKMGLLVWCEAVVVLVQLVFWGVAGRMFNVQQGKRLFGVIGSGIMAASIFGGIMIPSLVESLGTANLLFMSAAGVLASMAMLYTILKRFGPEGMFAKPPTEGIASTGSKQSMSRNRYFMLMASVTWMAVLGFYILSYVFYNELNSRYPDPDELAVFLGLYAAVIGSANFLSTTLISRRYISRFGVTFSVFTLPILLTLSAISVVAVGMGKGSLELYFWLIVLAKMIDSVLRSTIDKQSFLLLYQPLPSARRMRAQTTIETLVRPTAVGAAGGLLLVLTGVLNLSSLVLAMILLGVLVLWNFSVALLRKAYKSALVQAIARRGLGDTAGYIQDASILATLKKGLESPHIPEVLYSLQLIEPSAHGDISPLVGGVLFHPSPLVRLAALESIRKHGLESLRVKVGSMTQDDTDPDVKGAAIHTLCALEGEEILETASEFLIDPQPEVRAGAMVGLLQHGGIEGIVIAGQSITTMHKCDDATERALSARVLGEVGIANFYRPLILLLADKDTHVKIAACEASKKLANPRLWPHVINNLTDPEVRGAASTALAAGGSGTFPAMMEAFNDPNRNDSVRVQLARIVGRLKEAFDLDFLLDWASHPDPKVRRYVLIALLKRNFTIQKARLSTLQKLLADEVVSAVRCLATAGDLMDGLETDTLLNAQNIELDQCRQRILLLLSLMDKTKSLQRLHNRQVIASKENRSYVLEVLDIVLPQDLKEIIVPLLDDTGPRQAIERLAEIHRQPALGFSGRLREMLGRQETEIEGWTRACVLYYLGNFVGKSEEILTKEFHAAVIRNLDDSRPMVRETAIWALSRLAPKDLPRLLQRMRSDPSPRVASLAKQLEAGAS